MNPRANPAEVLPTLGALLVIIGAAILVYCSIRSRRAEAEAMETNARLLEFYAEVIDARLDEAQMQTIIQRKNQ